MVDHLPFYNKFRAPSMIMVIPTLLLGILAMFGLQEISKENNFKDLFKKYKISFYLLAVLFTGVVLFYFNSDFKSENEKQLLIQISQITDVNQKAAFESPAKDLVNAIGLDRKGFIESDLLKALLFIVLIGASLFLYFKKIINKNIFIISIGILAMIDLFQVNTKYLKSDSYIDAYENETTFNESPIDIELKKDTSDFRLLDMKGGIQNAFNGGALVAYHHKTVGGYNPAKLSIYQDLIENQWYKFPNCMPVVNMMNTKYILTGNMATDTIANRQALGNAWFVKGIEFKKGPTEVMAALSNFNPHDTAIMEESSKDASLNSLGYDSSSIIRLKENKNDEVTYYSTTGTKQFAVFSEVYYKLGWKAYIDNVETPIYKTNYVLRGIVVPSGKHEIRFEFKPANINMAQNASFAASLIIWLALGFMVSTLVKKKLKKEF